MHLALLLTTLALQTAPAPRCAPEGLYRASAGFFTRFDGKGHWESMTDRESAPVSGGRYDVDGRRIRFKLQTDGETPYDWSATFSENCREVVLKYANGSSPDIVFSRVDR